MEELSNEMAHKFAQYPPQAKAALLQLRLIILEVAALESVSDFTETLKWGQPSYLAKNASTVRIDWSEKDPEHYRLYFICNTKLIATFKELYPNTFKYENNRVIAFDLSQTLPIAALKHCLSIALRYHKVKHLPLLGG